MSQLYSDSIFWVELEKIEANPYQPRREFDEAALEDLADSIRQYGVLQPLVVTRNEQAKPDGGLTVSYELIAGERRLRASKIAGLRQVPVIIRSGEDAKMKLELAIIENLQREDLNPIDRARAFARLAEEFNMTHGQIGKKMGKSREYVSNSLRLLQLPQDIMDALSARKISEGHTRPLMMLSDRPDEQATLFKEIVYKKMSVRESEKVARSIASDKVRKKEYQSDPQLQSYQQTLSEKLGTRVHIEKKEVGGKIVIDFFEAEDVEHIIDMLKEQGASESMLEKFITQKDEQHPDQSLSAFTAQKNTEHASSQAVDAQEEQNLAWDQVPDSENGNDDRENYQRKTHEENLAFANDENYLKQEEEEEDPEIYSITNFSL